MFIRPSSLFLLLSLFVLGTTSTQPAASHVVSKRTEKVLKSQDGSDVYAVAVGNPKNPPIVFVHGLAMNIVVWDRLFANQELTKDFYLVAYDVRGHGRSGKPRTAEGYQSARYAQDYAAVEKEFNLVKPVVVGWSLGATIVVDILAQFGRESIAGVVYSGAVPYVDSSVIAAISLTIPQMTLVDILNNTGSVDSSLAARRAFLDGCFNEPSTFLSTEYSALLGATSFSDTTTLGLLLARQQDPAPLWKAGQDGLPLWLVYGSNEKMVNGTALTQIVGNHFRNINIQVIEGGSHSVFWEHEDVFVKGLKQFSKRVAGARGKGASGEVKRRLVSDRN